MNLLPYTIYLSFAGAALSLVAGMRSAATARVVALLTAVTCWGLTLYAACGFTPSREVLTLVDVPWISQLGIHYHLAVDGISLTLVVLTGLAATAGILFSWNIEERTGEFFAFYLALIGGVYGVFLSADAFLFFTFYEIAIVPKYFLIANWGSTNRQYGAMKLALYSFAGSALVLAGLLWIYAVGHAKTVAAGGRVRPEQADQDQRAAGERVQGQLHRAVLAVGRAPVRDQEILRHDGDFIENKEQEGVGAEKHPVHAADQRQVERKELAGPFLDIPGKQHAGRRRQAGQHHERQADAIGGEMVVDAHRGDPRLVHQRQHRARRHKAAGRQERDGPGARGRGQRHPAGRRGRPGARQQGQQRAGE